MGQLGGTVDRAPVQESGGPEFKSHLKHLTLTSCVTLGKSLNPQLPHPGSSPVILMDIWPMDSDGSGGEVRLVTCTALPHSKTKSSTISLMAWSLAKKDEHIHVR